MSTQKEHKASLGLFDKFTGCSHNNAFKSVSDIVPDLTGKNIVITGANSGVGKVSALEFAKKGAYVILACRSEERAKPVVEEIKAATGNQNIEFVRYFN